MLYTGERQRVMYSINIISGVEINFFDNLPVGQVLSNVYLPEKISICPKKGTLSFKFNLEKSTEFANYAWFRESSFYFRLLG